ncbi:MAG: glycoside hydrolase family 127 protein [Planctomycetes bacterium]|nr:glycoside hydrolase family 127 protein [Planctomycetota bacterium]
MPSDVGVQSLEEYNFTYDSTAGFWSLAMDPVDPGVTGDRYFYVNPLASMGNHQRSEWFGCACCPPNVLRTIASLGGYAYATSAGSLYVNLFVGGSMETEIDGQGVAIDVETDYPWDGSVTYTMKGSTKFSLRLRNPGWCNGATVSVNGTRVNAKLENGYFVLSADWRAGDKVELDLPMPVMQIEAHPYVKDDVGRAVIQRGPIVYCAEQTDNTVQVDELIVPRGTNFKAEYRADVLNGVVVVTADAQAVQTVEWDRRLYQPITQAETVKATFVPYGFWANRGRNKMVTWTPTTQPPARILGPEAKAEVSMSHVSGNAEPWGINDGIEPESSGQQPRALAHMWPRKGGEEWFQYTWEKEMAITGVEIYWFDDTGRGEIRLPKSWKLQSQQNGEWKDVPLDENPIALDKWCKVAFDKVTTTALRLVVQQQERWATGIHEWKVIASRDD